MCVAEKDQDDIVPINRFRFSHKKASCTFQSVKVQNFLRMSKNKAANQSGVISILGCGEILSSKARQCSDDDDDVEQRRRRRRSVVRAVVTPGS